MADQVLILQVRDLTATRRDIGVETATPGDWAARVLDPDSLAALADVLAELQGGISVNAVNLDTRPLTFATDAVDVSGSTILNAVLTDAHDNPNNALRVNVVAQSGGGLTDAELRATAIPVSGTVTVQDGGNVISVDAVDLDIRNLTFVADKVDASGTVLGAGNNNIGDVDVASLPTFGAGQATYAEDTAHTTGDRGEFILGVTTDGSTDLVSAFGDYSPIAVSTDGNVWVDTPIGKTLSIEVETFNTTLPAGTNNIGDVGIASIAAGDNNIGNVDIVTLPALVAGNANIGDVDIASIAAGTTRIGGTYTVSGQIIDNDGDVLTVKVAHLDMTTATTTDIVAAVATKKIRVLNWEISTLEPATVTDVNFATGAGTTRVTGSGKVRMTAENLTTSRVAAPGAFLFETVAGEALRVTQTGATDLTASVTYVEV